MNPLSEQMGDRHNPVPQELRDLAAAYESVSGQPTDVDAFVGKALEMVEIELTRLPKLVLTDPVVRDTFLGKLLGFVECRQLAEALRAGRARELDRRRLREQIVARIAEETRAVRIKDPFAPRDSLVYQLLGREQTEAVLGRLEGMSRSAPIC